MAFVKKTWKDRIVQFANRRLLTKSGGEVEQVTVTRDEGAISEAGDQFNASNMNDLENRIDNAITNEANRITTLENSKVNISDICYKSGDTDSVSFAILSGYVSNGTTNLEFSFIPDKIIPAGVSISITSLTITGRSTSGNYFLSNETITGNPSYTVTYSKRGKYINITVAKTSQFSGVTNNTPVSLVATIGYSFT